MSSGRSAVRMETRPFRLSWRWPSRSSVNGMVRRDPPKDSASRSTTLDGLFKSAHGLEVPFTTSPTSRALATSMSSPWIAFARSGAPTAKTLPAWPKYTTKDRATMVLDDHPRVVSDPFGERSPWEGVPLT